MSPSGTVTFLFTDIEGASAVLRDNPEALQRGNTRLGTLREDPGHRTRRRVPNKLRAYRWMFRDPQRGRVLAGKRVRNLSPGGCVMSGGKVVRGYGHER
jgi:hypothetical protein